MSTPSETRGGGRKAWLVPAIVIVVAVALIATVLLMNRSDDPAGSGAAGAAEGSESQIQGPAAQDPGAPDAAAADFTAVESREEGDPLAVGPVDAPVGLVVFSDYQCPYCAKWSQETLPLMMEHVEAGDLRIEWRDLHLFGPASERASRAAYAAARQDAFLEYHDALFAGGEPRPEAELSDEALASLADDLGLDAEEFAADYNSPETAEVVGDHAQLGIDLGAYSTPAFILGGQPIMGAQPAEVFQDAFDTALAENR